MNIFLKQEYDGGCICKFNKALKNLFPLRHENDRYAYSFIP